MEKRPALGKGLSALIPDSFEPSISPIEVDIDRLTPNELQPRGHMDPASLEDLSRSIVANGIIQPIIVRKVGDRFHIIAGERRWRASQRAGWLATTRGLASPASLGASLPPHIPGAIRVAETRAHERWRY